MKIVFCAEPFAPTTPDSAYAREVAAARRVGMEPVLIDFEALVNDHDSRAAVRRVPHQADLQPALYRGWMLRPAQYAALYDALLDRGLALLNDPAAYRAGHCFPESYPQIADVTPRSVWLDMTPDFRIEDVFALLAPFGDRPLIVKDYVKSRKHEWHEACFIPSAADHDAVARVTRRFLELQGAEVSGGLVFREFVALQPLTQHARSGMPLTQEFRRWFVDSACVLSSFYWDEGAYTIAGAPDDLFAAQARTIGSRFFTMDVAQRTDGSWIIVELGDGQVAGLPETADATAFYGALRNALDRRAERSS